jgi:hypothetical protein
MDYADDGMWEGAMMRLRTDLIAGRGPDVIMFDQWGDENDITAALMHGSWLADLNVFLENDPELSREDLFENILDIWTNSAGELALITGTVIPTPYWGPSALLEDFTDFTHEGFLTFLRDAEMRGVPYPKGLGFIPYTILETMLFADNTFFCLESGNVNFDSEIFLDILAYIESIPGDRHSRWMEALSTGEAWDPIPSILRGEQLMTDRFTLFSVNDFRRIDAALGGLTPIGAPNAAGDLAISTRPITRFGIRANIDNLDAAWEFVRLAVLYPDVDSYASGLPILRSLFEYQIDEAFRETSPLIAFFGFDEEIPPLTQEQAAAMRHIMESITHEIFPDPHVMAIVWEEVMPFLAGSRSAEDAARIIQSRVSIYVAERT